MQRHSKKQKTTARHTVGILLTRDCKSNRDRISGIMRSFAVRPNIHSVFVESNSPPSCNLIAFDAIIGDDVPVSRISKTALQRTKVVLTERLCDAPPLPYPAICLDNTAIGKAAAELLLRRGHTHFAYIGTRIKDEKQSSMLRGKAFSDFVEAAGFSCQSCSFPQKIAPHSEQEMSRLIKFIANLPLPCGIMVYADNMAQTVMDACRYLHLMIPEQISIIGVDNETEICENLKPPLTSILPDFEMAGYLAAETTARLLSGERISHDFSYGVKAVIERESTQDLRGGGRLVTLAMEFMRKNFVCQINVSDVASKLNVSRRLLEIRFREILGKTVWECLSEIRIAEAKRKLERTSLPVNEIMQSCGYNTYKPFRLAFFSSTGMTPTQWRNAKMLVRHAPAKPKSRGATSEAAPAGRESCRCGRFA